MFSIGLEVHRVIEPSSRYFVNNSVDHFLALYVGWLGVHPWLVALKGEYITRLTLIWWYACYYKRVDFMYVGMSWECPWLIALEGEYIRSTLM